MIKGKLVKGNALVRYIYQNISNKINQTNKQKPSTSNNTYKNNTDKNSTENIKNTTTAKSTLTT